MTRPVPLRRALAVALALVYALPLFLPPATPALGVPTPPEAWLLARIFPGVPPLWVGLRLAALAVAALWLTDKRVRTDVTSADVRPLVASGPARIAALVLAAAHLAAAPFAGTFGPPGQVAHLAMLAVPALVLAWGEGLLRPPGRGGGRGRAALPVVAVIVLWVACRFVTDVGSPRVADVIDGWRGVLDIVRFVDTPQNLLTELFDPKLPGVSGAVTFFLGVPLFQSGLVPFSLGAVQAFQILWVGVTAAGVGWLARLLIGPGVAAVAVAVFLFAPYVRFVAFLPGIFLAGPLYAVAVALAALLACRRRSAAGLAALGAAGGLALGFPGVVPLLGVLVLATLWHLRRALGARWVGVACGLLSFAAIVAPGVPGVYTPDRMGSHFRWDGLISVIDAGLLGQIPAAETAPAYEGVVQRPFDVVVSALLAPFANPRVAIRLWGDALFDPLGAVLLAVGLVVCVRSVGRSGLARALLVVYAVVLAPAFVSPVDVANIAYAIVLPVVVALVAAVGARALLGDAASRSWVAGVVVVVVVGGSLLFDLVNRRILPASGLGIMFEVTDTADLDRVVVLGYGPGFVRPTKTLYTGPITAFAGRRPVGYLEYDAGALPVADFAAERKDLLFWSYGYDQDVGVAAAICAAWPAATFFEIRDRAGLGRVHAARVGDAPWEPRTGVDRWQSRGCGGGA